jgi:hypothetical protein
MGAVTYPDKHVSQFITENLIPIQVAYNAKPLAGDFNITWTPTILTLDASGKEHHRIVGFLPPQEFIPALLLGIAKAHFDLEHLDQALALLDKILLDYGRSDAAPEAVYLRGVALYKSTHDAKPLKEAYERLEADYPTSEWAKRAAPYRLL